MRVVLGFDTSCYTTSVAAVDAEGEVVGSARMLLPVPAGQRGLRQSEAVFAHVRQTPMVMDELSGTLEERGAEIAAVCASASPCDGEDSYMPVFTVGLGHARVVAASLRVPAYETTHQRGHIAAGQLGNPKMDKLFVALHLSGGTTQLAACGPDGLRVVGGSLDLHAGQLIDRVGVAMGLPFPAGPELERLALRSASPVEGILPCSLEPGGLYCHFSGAETQALRLVKEGALPRGRVAAEVFDLVSRTSARMLEAGCRAVGASQALVVGGVASSALFREALAARMAKRRSNIRLTFGRPELSGDNAAGVAWIGMRRYLERDTSGT